MVHVNANCVGSNLNPVFHFKEISRRMRQSSWKIWKPVLHMVIVFLIMLLLMLDYLFYTVYIRMSDKQG